MFPAGSFAVLNTSGGFTDEATSAIVNQIAGQIMAKFESFLGPDGEQLLNTLPHILTEIKLQKSRIASIMVEMTTSTRQLNDQIPGDEGAQAAATASLEALSKRDREVSD